MFRTPKRANAARLQTFSGSDSTAVHPGRYQLRFCDIQEPGLDVVEEATSPRILEQKGLRPRPLPKKILKVR